MRPDVWTVGNGPRVVVGFVVVVVVFCYASQQHASVSQGQICSDTEIYVADQVSVSPSHIKLTQGQTSR